MSFVHHTPESLLERSDSKNPATTCKGLTTAGRPCRRALAVSVTNSPATTPTRKGNGVVAILDEGDAAAFFCWQHKDQAEVLIAGPDQRTQVLPLKQKSSIDTLMERIGILDLDDHANGPDTEERGEDEVRHRMDRNDHGTARPRKRHTLPQEWQNIQGPLMRVPEEVASAQGYQRQKHSSKARERYSSDRRHRSNVKASWGCCIRADDDDLRRPRRREPGHGNRMTRVRTGNNFDPKNSSKRSATRIREQSLPGSARVDQEAAGDLRLSPTAPSTITYPKLGPLPESPNQTPIRPSLPSQMSTSPQSRQTAALLSLIPTHLSPNTVSALLTELSKPISSADEDGYIYIFWLTPDSDVSKPDDETASSLLDPDDWSPYPSPHRIGPNGHQRRSEVDGRRASRGLTTQALQRFASIKHGPTESRNILLKIGRAGNVHRRLTQWTKQCGQNITLIRYYPYQPRNNSTSESFPRTNSGYSAGGTVPHVHRVERLIHLELADQRVAGKGKCEQCNREHKEWFEVEATKDGVRAVDQVVRKWVDWAKTMA